MVEVCAATYEQIRELRKTGLINIIQNSKQRFFVSEDERAAERSLGEVLKMYPPLHLVRQEIEGSASNSIKPLEIKSEMAALPGRLVEPTVEEVRRITARS